jgi:hypothetical protein
MVYEDEIIFEQYFPSENMNEDTRNLCLSLIGQSKEFTDSPKVVDNSEPFDFVSMSLNKRNNIVTFNGFISNGIENKFLDGRIVKSNNCYFLKTNVYRLYEYLDDDERQYSLDEKFELLDDCLVRKTLYSDAGYYDEVLPALTHIDIDSFAEEQVRRLRRINNN